MDRSLSDSQVRAVRMRAQLLSGKRPRDLAAAVARVAALQAQATPAARLAIRARTTGSTMSDVDRAANDERSVVRTWLMRGTLHMVAAADVRWMVGVFGPVFAAAGRRRREELGLTDRVCERGLAAMSEVLAGSAPLARAALVERIADEGVRVDARTQAPAHLLAYAAMRGLICRGPDVERDEPTYVRLDDWVPAGDSPSADSPTGDGALSELARRYLAAYGPASVQDFRAWSGLPAAHVRRAFDLIADEIDEVKAAGGPVHVLSTMDLDAVGERVVRLLGQFDAYLLGFRSRDLVLETRYARRIQAGGGIIHPAVVVDGRVAGTWRLDRKGRRLTVRVEPFGALPRGTRGLLAAEAEDVARFLDASASLEVVPAPR